VAGRGFSPPWYPVTIAAVCYVRLFV
jgi:hypothetical protein